MPKTYNDLYLATRTALKNAGADVKADAPNELTELVFEVVTLHVDGVDVGAGQPVLALPLERHATLHLALGGKLPCGQDLLLREEREAAKHAVGKGTALP